MKTLRGWIRRLAGLLPNGRREREMADEIDSHLQLHIDDNLRAGMTLEQARREAVLKLGGVEPTKEAYRDGGTVPFVEHTLQDVRFSLRQLRKNPGFTCTAIAMLALGLCASVTIFAFVDAALLKPLPYREASRLVGVYEQIAMFPQSNLSYLDYVDWKKLNKVFESLEAYNGTGAILTTAGGPQPLRGAFVTDGFFRALGVRPVLGRDFQAGEDKSGSAQTVILSYATWQKRFGGRTGVIGTILPLDGAAMTIVGILPREFHFAPLARAEFWATLHGSGSCEMRRSCHNLFGVARLKDGVSVETALADVKLIAKQLEKQYPGSNQGQGATVVPLTEVIVGDVRPILLVMLGGAGLLLLIACVNIASLLLVRSESRRRELAVRTALGASRSRLIRQFVTEGMVLVVAGSAIGIASATWAMQLLSKLIPADMLAGMPYLQGLGLNGRVLAYAGFIAVLAAVLFSLTPALHFSFAEMRGGMRGGMREGLIEGSRGSAGNAWRRLGSKLVVVELGTAMVLLAGAGLIGKSLYLLLHVDIGLQPDRLTTLFVAAPDARYGKEEQSIALVRRVISRVENLPGVISAGVSNQLPVSGNGNTDWIRFPGRPYHGEHNEVNQRDASPRYFQTLKTKLVRGRYFTPSDGLLNPHVVIINQTLARQYYAGEDPIGQQFGDDELSPKSMRQIVGIVEDIKEGALDTATWPAEYVPFDQDAGNQFALVVRTSQDEESVVPALFAAIHAIDPTLVVEGGATMNTLIRDSQAAYIRRSTAWLLGGFAAMALLLGVAGLYGVIAYSVSQRTREIGVRMALGAETGAVHRMILREAGWLIGTGILAGLACSIAAATLIRKLLFGIQSWDVETLGGVAGVLAVSAMLASYLPARRAARVNPIEALRME